MKTGFCQLPRPVATAVPAAAETRVEPHVTPEPDARPGHQQAHNTADRVSHLAFNGLCASVIFLSTACL